MSNPAIDPVFGDIFKRVMQWDRRTREQLASYLLVGADRGFHGSIEIHFCGGTPKKVVDKPAAATREI